MIDKLKQLLAPDVDIAAKLAVVSAFFGRILTTHDQRLVDLEARQLQKGDKGDRGEKGEKGDPGVAGKDGQVGATGPKGDTGPAGKDGKQGKNGKDGISVVSAEVALDNHLVFTLSNGKIIDAGELPTADEMIRTFVSGNAWQIYVGNTPPANPPENQLWFATNLTSACN